MRKHENRETPERKTLRGLHWVTMITRRTLAKKMSTVKNVKLLVKRET